MYNACYFCPILTKIGKHQKISVKSNNFEISRNSLRWKSRFPSGQAELETNGKGSSRYALKSLPLKEESKSVNYIYI